jgi:hypothetical protein
VFPKIKTVPGHQHANAAGARNAASNAAAYIATISGYKPFYESMSRADQRHGHSGTRIHHWAKDMCIKLREDNPDDDSLIAYIDVDYYVDMPYVLARDGAPAILYTVVPEEAAEQTGDTSFTFLKDGSLETYIAGGGHFRHPLWDYSCDSLIVSTNRCVLFANTPFEITISMPFYERTAVFMVDRLKVDKHRQLILLTPVAKWTASQGYITRHFPDPLLTRFDPRDGDFAVLKVQTQHGLYGSVARLGTYAATTDEQSRFDAIKCAALHSKTGITNAMVASHLRNTTYVATSSLPLYDYFKSTVPGKSAFVLSADYGVQNYQYYLPYYDEDAKPCLEPYMSPLLPGTFIPAKSYGNEMSMTIERVIKPARNEVQPDSRLMTLVADFIKEIRKPLGADNYLIPADIDEVYEKQNRPSQRRILAEADITGQPDRRNAPFQKAETYGDVKPTRQIAQINGVDKQKYSRYTYSASTYLKQEFRWYAFGHTPLEIASRVALIAQHATQITCTDFSKFDGHVSTPLRNLEEAVMLNLFSSSYRPELAALMRSQYNLKGRTRLGIRTPPTMGRMSGSPETSLLNTICNAFVAYAAIRQTPVNGKYPTSEEAFMSLGIYGGDDGLTADVDSEIYESVAKKMGQCLTSTVYKRDESGVNFLARLYSPLVWNGESSSMCDIARQLLKLHVAAHLTDVTPLMKLRAKCLGFALTDANTPILGPYCQLVLAKTENISVATEEFLENNTQTTSLINWWYQYDRSVQFPNVAGEWMYDYTAKALSIETGDVHAYERDVIFCSTVDVLQMPIITEGPAPTRGVVNGDVITVEVPDAEGEAVCNAGKYAPASPPPSTTEVKPVRSKKTGRKTSKPPNTGPQTDSKEEEAKEIKEAMPRKPRGQRGKPASKKSGVPAAKWARRPDTPHMS